MPHVSHTVHIARPIATVFDLATTARYWPQWHPATLGVSGAVDYPARLGDQIIERVDLGGHIGEGTWTVVATHPPTQLALESHTGLGLARITYTLTETPDGVHFRRDLDYERGSPALDALMARQSAVAVANLKALLEREIPAAC